MVGMDPHAVRRLAVLLEHSSQRLRGTGTAISATLGNTGWEGHDSRRFRQTWDADLRPELAAAARSLAEASRTLKHDAMQQEEASASPFGGSGLTPGAVGASADTTSTEDLTEDPLGWLREAIDDVWEESSDAGLDFALRALDSFSDVSTDGLGLARHSADMAAEFLMGEPPSVTELLALGALTGGVAANLSVVGVSAGQFHPHLLDDGHPTAGEPLRVGVEGPGSPALNVNGHQPTVLPSSLSAIAHNTALAYSDKGAPGTENGAVRITRIGQDGVDSYIVNIPGTQSWNPSAGANPSDMTGNLVTASGQSSTTAEAVRLAMREAGIPSGAPIMLAGHSQGGMTAAQLAGNEGFTSEFNVTNVMTYGSPIDTAHISPTVDVIAFEHAGDVVPRVDLGNLRIDPLKPPSLGFSTPPPPNEAIVVSLSDPEPGDGSNQIVSNHDYNNYADSIAEVESRRGSTAATYQGLASTSRFLTDDPSRVESHVIPIGRKQ